MRIVWLALTFKTFSAAHRGRKYFFSNFYHEEWPEIVADSPTPPMFKYMTKGDYVEQLAMGSTGDGLNW